MLIHMNSGRTDCQERCEVALRSAVQGSHIFTQSILFPNGWAGMDTPPVAGIEGRSAARIVRLENQCWQDERLEEGEI